MYSGSFRFSVDGRRFTYGVDASDELIRQRLSEYFERLSELYEI